MYMALRARRLPQLSRLASWRVPSSAAVGSLGRRWITDDYRTAWSTNHPSQVRRPAAGEYIVDNTGVLDLNERRVVSRALDELRTRFDVDGTVISFDTIAAYSEHTEEVISSVSYRPPDGYLQSVGSTQLRQFGDSVLELWRADAEEQGRFGRTLLVLLVTDSNHLSLHACPTLAADLDKAWLLEQEQRIAEQFAQALRWQEGHNHGATLFDVLSHVRGKLTPGDTPPYTRAAYFAAMNNIADPFALPEPARRGLGADGGGYGGFGAPALAAGLSLALMLFLVTRGGGGGAESPDEYDSDPNEHELDAHELDAHEQDAHGHEAHGHEAHEHGEALLHAREARQSDVSVRSDGTGERLAGCGEGPSEVYLSTKLDGPIAHVDVSCTASDTARSWRSSCMVLVLRRDGAVEHVLPIDIVRGTRNKLEVAFDIAEGRSPPAAASGQDADAIAGVLLSARKGDTLELRVVSAAGKGRACTCHEARLEAEVFADLPGKHLSSE